MADTKEIPKKLLRAPVKIFTDDPFAAAKDPPSGFKSYDEMLRWRDDYMGRWYGYYPSERNPTAELKKVLAALKEATEVDPEELIPALRIAGYQIEAEYSQSQMEVVVRFKKVK